MGKPVRFSRPEASRSDAAQRIRAAGKGVTPFRVKVLQILLEVGHPISHLEIQERMSTGAGGPVDRVTLYRNLEWLVQQDLAHRVTADDRIWRFSAARTGHPAHPHFHCLSCGQVVCLPKSRLPSPELPENYAVQDVEMVVNGICPGCREAPGLHPPATGNPGRTSG